ncbi:hypothetical protein B0H14DRAFT_3488587 [Mycena olivaceomarginata]|nr:hypothetical protein B0H14DRAFT_3488587 [Mycena olivaceomarginata]
MSDHPFPMVEDSAGLDHVTFTVDHRITRYFFVVGLSILVYVHLLTLGAEVKYIWSSKLRPSTSWFLAVRYIGLGANIVLSVFNFGDFDHESIDILDRCIKMQWVWDALLLTQEVLVEVTLSLRVFAIYGHNVWVLICLLPALCVSASLGLWSVIGYAQHPEIVAVPGLVGCHAAYRHAAALRERPSTFPQRSQLKITQVRGNTHLRHTLVRADDPEGIHAAEIAVLGDGLIAGFLSWFTTNLSVTLLSRLMLNLHDTGVARIDTNLSDLETIRFTDMRRTSVTE